MKRCTHCAVEKPLEAGFYRSAKARDGYASWCRSCTDAKAAGAKERWKASERGREKLREARRRYYDTHLRTPAVDRTCPRCSSVFTTTRSQQVYCSEECSRVRRSALRYGPNSRMRRRLMARDGWKCYLCSFPVDPTLRWPDELAGTLDHVIPVTRGGTSHHDNLRLAHWACNREKGENDAPWWVAA